MDGWVQPTKSCLYIVESFQNSGYKLLMNNNCNDFEYLKSLKMD